MYAFDEHTRVERIGEARWSGAVADVYNVGSAPNGGYLMAIGARALAGDLAHPHPLTVTAHYLRRSENGPVEIRTTVVREGRTLSTGAASLFQDGREVVRLLATFTDLETAEGPSHVSASAPDLPDPEDLPSSADVPGLPAVVRAFDHRLTPASVGFALGVETGRAEVEGYTRFPDDRPVDPFALLLVADALPPPVLNVVEADWVPTIEMTVHVRAIPSPGWLSFRLGTRALVDGHLDEDGEIWDRSGRLVAMSRQIALVLPPRDGGRRGPQ
ncbi:MAG: thioesterase family protein [Acidimicrobiia bacterium]|nr:thioesterase family protein [Acidimicrobiia bacterium]